jgi:hypothetical protein
MKERINLILTDLDNYELTVTQLLSMFEKISLNYVEKDIEKYEHLVEGFLVFFYMQYQLIKNNKEEKGG